MFKKILIANRGEIAVRIIRACREMGIETVAIYSKADEDALHAQMADEAICIGPAKSRDSYLNIQNIISATVLTGAEAIHPGFGFLSENSDFAEMCNECNITFIGPDSNMIRQIGDKAKAKELMIKSDVPVIPGFQGVLKNEFEALKKANEIGYPLMIKASAGGGGRGIRIVYNENEFINSYKTAQAEAKACFGDDTMYLERFIQNPRHIEIQILADEFGNTVYLGERDCSIQRRNQKIIEETPSVIVDEDLRRRMGEAAVRAAKAVEYKNAGTIEFLVDDDKNFYFMEMNTRIQVEHAITEMVTGIDLIKEQIKIAWGEKLSFKQEDIEVKGHAIECRINAENPSQGFRPCPGKINALHVPGGFGVRVDTAIYQGYVVPAVYDSMIAKVITYGKSREEAIDKMKSALGEFIIEGIDTNIDFLFTIINHEDFINGNFHTGFVGDKLNA